MRKQTHFENSYKAGANLWPKIRVIYATAENRLSPVDMTQNVKMRKRTHLGLMMGEPLWN
jgi:hypothetical protein